MTWVTAAVLLLLALTTSRVEAAAPPSRLVIGGLIASDPVALGAVLGDPPQNDTPGQLRWGERAIKKTLAWLHARGYGSARAWFNPYFEGAPTLYVDEGEVIKMEFKGGDFMTRLLAPMDIELPNRLAHGPTLDRSLKAVIRANDLAPMTWQVQDHASATMTLPWGAVVPARVLEINAAEQMGRVPRWNIHLDSSAQNGLRIFATRFIPDAALERDELAIGGYFEIPYREMFLDADPRLDWRAGAVLARYRLPPLGSTTIQPVVATHWELIRRERLDINIDRYTMGRTWTDFGVTIKLAPTLRLEAAIGFEWSGLFSWTWTPSTPRPGDRTIPLPNRVGLTTRVELGWVQGDVNRRKDLRDHAAVIFSSVYGGRHAYYVALEAEARKFWLVNRHTFTMGGRFLAMPGEPFFWDQVPLYSQYMRVTTDPETWIRYGATFEAAWRIDLAPGVFGLGLFNDFGIYRELEQIGEKWRAQNMTGVSAHLVISEAVAFDVYYGMAFTPYGTAFALTFGFNQTY